MLLRDYSLRSTVGYTPLVIVLTLLCLSQSVCSVEAQTTTTWTGGTSTNWFTGSNWDTGEVPNDLSVIIPTTDVVINGEEDGPATVRLTEDGRTVVRSLSIGAGDNLQVGNSFFGTPRLAISGSIATNDQNILSNQGVISLATGGGSFSTSEITLELTNNIALSGGGTIELTDAEVLFSDSFLADPEVTNVDNQIQGFGEINLRGVDNFTNANAGVIAANQDGQLLRIRDATVNVDFTNEGTLRAVNGGELSFHLGITNTGTIEALDRSTIVLERGAIVDGGILRASGTGTVEVSADDVSTLNVPQSENVSLRDVILDATIDLQQGASLNLQGTIENNQSITTQESTGVFTPPNSITVNGEANLTGGGTIDLVDSELGFVEAFFAPAAAGNLTNSDNTIQGSGSIAANFVNEADGLVLANRIQGELEIVRDTFIFEDQTTINRGTFRAEDGGTLSLFGGSEVINEGVIEALDNSLVEVRTDVSGGIHCEALDQLE